ncbi:MAG TPA: PxKF domain-containing protein [Gemmatimonadales bacterium]|nr:PxKF domain-containing protein [Gemmatimonadales bacterium]
MSLNVANTTSSTGPSVLILADADGASTVALADTLTAAGFQVTVRPAPEYTWDGTNPTLTGFDVVVHLNGATYDGAPGPAAQQALNSFVENGGGYVGAQWNGVEFTPSMADLVLQSSGGSAVGPEQNCAGCQVTYQTISGQEGHPVLAGLPSSFTFTADGHDAGPQVNGLSTVLMQVSAGGPAVLVRQFGTGKVVNFSFAPNYPFDESGMPHNVVTLLDVNVKGLYVNAVSWMAGSAVGEPQPQTITFDPIADKVYGDPAFAVSATASSNLPVSLSAAGQCTVAGTTVTITAAGSCTITAQQAGNADYHPAEDVIRSFAIVKAPATITIGTEYTFDGTVKSAMVTTQPAGLDVVTLTYNQNGSPVAQPINAGVYQVLGTLDNPNYEAPPATGTLTIRQAQPVLSWTEPAPITAGTPLGAAQLNASATGIGGISLTETFVYLPAAGTVLAAGSHPLSVEFFPGDANYARAIKTVNLTVLPRSYLRFSGFLRPVYNLPYVNRMRAGRSVPLIFAVQGSNGESVLKEHSLTSTEVSCKKTMIERQIKVTGKAETSWLHARGTRFTYVWKTSADWAGTCRSFVVKLEDGSKHEALFHFTGNPKPENRPSGRGGSRSRDFRNRGFLR